MSFGKDLVAAQNCGTANAAAGFTQSIQQMNGRIGDAKQFENVMNGGLQFQSSSSASSMHDMLHSAPMHQHGDVDAFTRQFNAPAKGQAPLMGRLSPPLSLPQQQHQSMRTPSTFDADAMAREFERMQLQLRQPLSQQAADDMIKEFETKFQNNQPLFKPLPQMHAPPAPWANEFQHMHPQQQHQHRQHSHHASQHQQWVNEFDRQAHMRNVQQQMHHQLQHMLFQHQQQPHQPWLQQQQQPFAEQKKHITDQEFQDIYGDTETESKFEEAYKQADTSNKQQQPQQQDTGSSWANEFADQQQQEQNGTQGEAPGIGGLDKDMLDKLMNSDDPKWRNSKFLRFINKISNGQIEFRDNQAIEKPGNDDWAAEFDGNKTANPNNDWASQFNTQQQHEGGTTDWQNEFAQRERDWAEQFGEDGVVEEGDADANDPLTWDDEQVNKWAEEYSKDLEDNWKMQNWMGEFQSMANEANAEAEYKDPVYVFDDTNPFKQDGSQAFERGVALLKAGELKQAIAAFEAAVQHEPDHADAWCYLGQAQAENEDENNAIAALLKSVSIDPYNLKALLMLGVSYTNDLEEHRALNYLKTWLLNNPDYQHPSIQQFKQSIQQYESLYGSDASTSQQGPIVDVTLHDEVTRMFLAALQLSPNDAELHTVLGVLYHITGDFDKAIDSFKHAIALKPDDAQLWNKLGATQANSSRSSDAVYAYQRALELRPSYVRALANLAISYANQGMHEDAVRQYLVTLKHNPNANHIWSYLRISLSHLGKDNLVELAQQKNVELFRQFYQF